MTQPAEQRHAVRRERIVGELLPIVEDLLAAAPYFELKVEQIIQRAGMARSTFYRYFQDKGELLLAVSEPAIADILAAASRVWELPADATREDLETTMRNVIVQYRPHTPLMQAMVETSAYDAAVRAAFQGAWSAARASQADHIRHGQAEGWIRPELDPEETSGWLVWMAERGMYQLVPGADDAALDRLSRSFAAILWHTLYAEKT
ncbi:MAG: TetR/AcrR family transcriptional regulator, ethionamide resistance regulator [Solirubrobacteraceae bacterium]|nr:TetR/AcrR family transcriptional regulator, ethionamide resistance regulator [Solirubrobacteraceae bacterium]